MAPRMNNKRGKGRRSNNNGRAMNARFNQLQTKLLGAQRIPGADIPTYVANPWNTLTLFLSNTRTIAGPANVDVSVNNVLNGIIGQLNIPVTVLNILNVRLLEVGVWDCADEISGSQLELRAFDLVKSASGNPRSISTQVDSPGKDKWARLKYIWPNSHQNVIFDNTFTDTSLFGVSATEKGSTKIHVRLLWKFRSPVTEPEVGTLDQLVDV